MGGGRERAVMLAVIRLHIGIRFSIVMMAADTVCRVGGSKEKMPVRQQWKAGRDAPICYW